MVCTAHNIVKLWRAQWAGGRASWQSEWTGRSEQAAADAGLVRPETSAERPGAAQIDARRRSSPPSTQAGRRASLTDSRS